MRSIGGAEVPADEQKFYAFPHRGSMARQNPAYVHTFLTKGDHGMHKYRPADPYILFVPCDYLDGRSLVDIEVNDATASAKATRAFARLMLAEVVRGAGQLFVSLYTRDATPIGYYWVLFEREQTDETKTAADALIEHARPQEGEAAAPARPAGRRAAAAAAAEGGDDADGDGDAAGEAGLLRAIGMAVNGGGGHTTLYTDQLDIVQWMCWRLMGSPLHLALELRHQYDTSDHQAGSRALSGSQVRRGWRWRRVCVLTLGCATGGLVGPAERSVDGAVPGRRL